MCRARASGHAPAGKNREKDVTGELAAAQQAQRRSAGAIAHPWRDPDDQYSRVRIACNRRSAREKYQIARPPSTGHMQHKRASDQTSAEKLIALTAQRECSPAKIRNGAAWLRVAG